LTDRPLSSATVTGTVSNLLVQMFTTLEVEGTVIGGEAGMTNGRAENACNFCSIDISHLSTDCVDYINTVEWLTVTSSTRNRV